MSIVSDRLCLVSASGKFVTTSHQSSSHPTSLFLCYDVCVSATSPRRLGFWMRTSRCTASPPGTTSATNTARKTRPFCTGRRDVSATDTARKTRPFCTGRCYVSATNTARKTRPFCTGRRNVSATNTARRTRPFCTGQRTISATDTARKTRPFCTGQWNDLSYRHSSQDPALLYR